VSGAGSRLHEGKVAGRRGTDSCESSLWWRKSAAAEANRWRRIGSRLLSRWSRGGSWVADAGDAGAVEGWFSGGRSGGRLPEEEDEQHLLFFFLFFFFFCTHLSPHISFLSATLSLLLHFFFFQQKLKTLTFSPQTLKKRWKIFSSSLNF